MDEPAVFSLPSGAELKVPVSDFKVARALYQTVLRECGVQQMSANLVMSSVEIEKAIWRCMERCLYNGVKITEQIFEPVEARQDYVLACFYVAQENIAPFTKALT